MITLLDQLAKDIPMGPSSVLHRARIRAIVSALKVAEAACLEAEEGFDD